MSDLRIDNVFSVLRGPTLDVTCTVECECGYFRSCGYMSTTADRLAELHRAKGESHNVTITQTEAEPLTRAIIRSRVNKWTGKRGRATIELQLPSRSNDLDTRF